MTNVLEGSVRKAGSRIRVTAQLITAADGSHLWSERYDREMTDVFAIQDEIAQAIAGALQMKLAAKPGRARHMVTREGTAKLLARVPESISYRTAPKLNTSERASSGLPSACSGDMYVPADRDMWRQ